MITIEEFEKIVKLSLSDDVNDIDPKLPKLLHSGYFYNGILKTVLITDCDFGDYGISPTEITNIYNKNEMIKKYPDAWSVDDISVDVRIGKITYRGFLNGRILSQTKHFKSMFEFDKKIPQIIDFSDVVNVDPSTGFAFIQVLSKAKFVTVEFDPLKLFILMDYIGEDISKYDFRIFTQILKSCEPREMFMKLCNSFNINTVVANVEMFSIDSNMSFGFLIIHELFIDKKIYISYPMGSNKELDSYFEKSGKGFEFVYGRQKRSFTECKKLIIREIADDIFEKLILNKTSEISKTDDKNDKNQNVSKIINIK